MIYINDLNTSDDCTISDKGDNLTTGEPMDDVWNHGGSVYDNNGVKYSVNPSEFRRSGNFVIPNGGLQNMTDGAAVVRPTA